MNTQSDETAIERLTRKARQRIMVIVPQGLHQLRQWVNWRFEQRDGQDKPTKVPVSPITGGPASVTDPATWGSFLDVNRYIGREMMLAGWGFVFTEDDPYLGIDLDNAIDEAGNLTPLAAEIVKRLNSYTEESVSGRGIHIIIKGALPGGRGRKNPKTGVEAYDRRRYFVMTGRRIPGTPETVEDRQDVLDTLLPELFPERATLADGPPPPGPGNSLADQQLLAKAKGGTKGDHFRMLWEGRWREAGYPSQSEADLALCSSLAFWTNRDEARIDALFRRSGLMRPKWDRQDYREGTLRRALENPNGYTGGALAGNPFPRQATVDEVIQRLMGAPVPALAAVPAPGTAAPLEPPMTVPAQAPVAASVAAPAPPSVPTGISVPTVEQLSRLDAVKMAALKEATLVHNYGPPFTVTKHGVSINQPYLAARFRLDHLILYEPNIRAFYTYDANRGLWSKQTDALVKTLMHLDVKKIADANGLDAVLMKCTDGFLTALVRLLQGYAEERDPFVKAGHVIHLQNGMLDLDAIPPVLRPFSPDYRSRNQSPIAYDPQARCPQFIESLLRPVLSQDDIDLLQRWAGMALLGTNLAQRFMIQTGAAGAGKGTFANIVEGIIGLENVAQLRTSFLGERFELYGFLDRTLLTGKDVPGSFLNDKGAHVIKALVGNDLLTAEKKGGETFQIRGNFNMLIASNSRLRVRLDGDTDAWRRRLLIVEYRDRPENVKTVPDLDQLLLRDEAAGILNWMVQGAVKLLGELDALGRYSLTPRQQARIDNLLSESDSVRVFVRKRITRSDAGDLTVEEVTKAYTEFCEDRGWEPLPVRQVEGLLRDVMHEVHRSAKRNDIKRNGKSQRGFTHVEFTEVNEEQ